MANSKFFSGLSEKMMSRNYNGPNRQATHFYWPDETDAEEIPLPRSRSRRTSVSSVASVSSAPQVPPADLEQLRKKHLQQMESKIDQYLTVDATSDTESEKRDRRPKKLNLTPKKESYENQDEPQNYRRMNSSPKRESFDYYQDEPINHKKPPKPESPANKSRESRERRDSRESREYREQPRTTIHQVARQQSQELERHMRNFSMNDANGLCTDYSAPREPNQRRQQRYEDSYSESDDDYSVISKSRGFQGYQEESRRTPQTPRTPSTPQTPDLDYVADYRSYERNRKPKYRVRAPERVNSRNKLRAKQYSPEVSDEEHYDFDKQKSSYEQLNQQKTPPRSVRGQETQLKETLQNEEDAAYYTDVPRPPSSKNGYSSELDDKRAPRTKQSMASTPGKPLSRSSSIHEAKKRALIHLNSNIFHNNPDYNKLSEHRKPTTVREAAGHSRVGVGLPDI